MGLEGALFTFPLCTFAQKIQTSNISPVTFFLCTSTLINLEYIPLNSLTTTYMQGQLQHISLE
jgi:hypothetical protein